MRTRATIWITFLLVAALLSPSMALAANNPGHDSLYVLKLGDNVTGSINITGNLTATLVRFTNRAFGDYLDINANGTILGAPSAPRIMAGANSLYIDSSANTYINTKGGTSGIIQVGDVLTNGVTLNVSGTIKQRNVNVCLQDGTNCPVISGSSSAGGWTNTTTQTSTALNVSVAGNLSVLNDLHVGRMIYSPTSIIIINDTTNIGNGAMLVQYGANIGMGTGAPGAKLDVVGTINATTIQTSGTTRISNTGVGTFASGTTINSQNICLADGTNCPVLGGSSSAGGWTNTTTTTSTTLNVGVGTASPSEKLAVVGNLSTTGGATLATSSGSVGIGTGAPSYQLDVGGAFAAVPSAAAGIGGVLAVGKSGSELGTIKALSTSGRYFALSMNNTHDAVLESSFGTITLKPATNVIVSQGSFGIGTAAPTQKLDVNGSVNITGNITVPHNFYIGNGAAAGGIYATALGSAAYAGGTRSTALGMNATAYGGFSTALGNMAAASDMAVGVGNGAQAGSQGTALGSGATAAAWGTAIGYQTTASGGNAIAFGVGASASGAGAAALTSNAAAAGNYSIAAGFLATASYNHSIGLGAYATPTAQNQMMIGSASYPLNTIVHGTFNTTGNLYEGVNRVCTAANGLCASSVAYQSSAAGWVNDSTTTRTQLRTIVNSSSLLGSFIVQSQTGSQHLFVNGSSGNVGIGTTGSSYKLAVVNSDTNTDTPLLVLGNANYGSNNLGVHLNTPAAYDVNIRNIQSAGGLYLSTYSGTGFYLSSAGNAGIGTTGPTAKLHINSSLSNGSLLIQNTTGSTHLFVNGSSGYAGIGTVAPSEQLHIAGGNVVIGRGNSYLVEDGTNKVSVAYFDSGNSILRIADGLFNARYASFVYLGEPAVAGIVLDNNANSIGLRTGGTSRIFINSSGGVGVGTTGPQQALDVNGSIAVVGTTRISNTGVGTFASGTTVNGQNVCLADGTNCLASGGATGYTQWRLGSNTGTIVAITNNTLVNITAGAGITTTLSGSNITIANTGDTNAGDDLTTSTVFSNATGDVNVTGAYNALSLQIGGRTVDAAELALTLNLGSGQTIAYSSGTLNANQLMGQASTYFLNTSGFNAGNVTSGNLAVARMPTGGSWALSTNLDVDSGTLYVDQANNRVGIGTASPSYNLSVNGVIQAVDYGSAGSANIYIGDDTFLTDIDTANTLGIYGSQDNAIASIKLGSGGPVISGLSGNVGIGTTAPVAKMHVQDGALLINGTTGGTPTISGAGTRMMWIPAKSAFRAGNVSGNHWDDANIGLNSVALGYDNKAAGALSFAAGYGNNVTNSYSFALGQGNELSHWYGVAIGNTNTISQVNSFAFGTSNTVSSNGYGFAIGTANTASGGYSYAIGGWTTASGSSSVTLGSSLTASGEKSAAIGSGIDNSNRGVNAVPASIAFFANRTTPTMFLNGTAVGIGTNLPNATLHVNSSNSAGVFLVQDSNTLNNVLLSINASSGVPSGVGIGTRAPAERLHIYDWTYPQTLKVESGLDGNYVRLFLKGSLNSQGWNITSQGANGGNGLYFAYGSTNAVTFASSGNVGIGQTSPGSKLEIAGNLTATGNIYSGGNQVCTAANGLCNSGASSTAAGWTNTTTQTTTLYNVGIGTASPNIAQAHIKAEGGAPILMLGDVNDEGYIYFVGNDINSYYNFNGNAELRINQYGYQQGYGQFRDLRIDDGKGNALAFFDGSAGSVGINTTTPYNRFTIADSSRAYTDALTGAAGFSLSSGSGAQTDDNLLMGVHTGDYAWIQAVKPGTIARDLALQPNGGNVGIGTTTPQGLLHLRKTPSGSAQPQVVIDTGASGLSRIGAVVNTSNIPRLDIAVNTYYNGSDWNLDNQSLDGHVMTSIPNSTPLWVRRFPAGSNPRTLAPITSLYISATDNVGIGTASPTQALEVNGSLNVSGVGNIWYKGNLTGYGADLAEFIPGENVEPGDVVVLSPTTDGTVIKSTTPYDTTVAGIISTRPSHIMGAEEGNAILALAGRVPVKVTGENGPIRRGDLLTTSNTPGRAMRCTDRAACSGAIVGKAMEPFDGSTGTITALVVLG